MSEASFLTTVIQEYSQQAQEGRTKLFLSSFNKHYQQTSTATDVE